MPTPRSVPEASWPIVILIASAAVLANLAVQGRVASVAGGLACVLIAFVIVAVPRRRTPTAMTSAGLAVLLASNLVLRSSDWVTGPTVVACGGLLVIAALDQLTSARFSGLGRLLTVMLEAALGSLEHLASPFSRWMGPPGSRRTSIVRGAVLATIVAVALTLLLANADAVVGQLVVGGFESSMWSHLVISAALAAGISTLAVVSHQPIEPSGRGRAVAPRPVEAAMGLAAVAAVLAAWAALQVTVALGGADRLLSTASVTRADHAREGFFELVVVVVVVLTMQIVFGTLLGPDRRTQAVALNAMVGGLTSVLVAITFSRLVLYIDAYGLTVLRLSVAWFLAWLGLLVIAVSAKGAGIASRRRWIATTTIVSAALTVVVFGWSNPEATVAATNLDRGHAVVQLDRSYLRTLGPDAARVLESNGITPGVACTSDTHPFGPFGWNHGWAKACR